MSEQPSVFVAFSAVMADVQGIAKKDENTQQRFNFRGIDAVMNAVGPALREHGVVIIPQALDITVERYESRGGAGMKNSTVQMQYTVYGPNGDYFIGSAYGEAADSGDKSVSKAQSVAYRTFLLQGLTVPTHEPDPDSSAHERVAAPQPSDADKARADLLETLKFKGIQPQEATQKFADGGHGDLRESEDVPALRKLIDHYRALKTGGGA